MNDSLGGSSPSLGDMRCTSASTEGGAAVSTLLWTMLSPEAEAGLNDQQSPHDFTCVPLLSRQAKLAPTRSRLILVTVRNVPNKTGLTSGSIARSVA